MSGGPFRELFVEVVEALLQGAVAQATHAAAHREPSRSSVVLDCINTAYAHLPWSWVTVGAERSPASRTSVFHVRCKRCKRHRDWPESETLLEASEVNDSMRRIVDKIAAFAEQHEACR